ncbi:hypothetical protein R70006_00103 [Paraburkholderia domus]|uniref:DUF3443 domain-containing protein n=1 Tax=Paraburkholderia domus TaxID=2793075 RepID=UPI0019136F5F|nr:DUF3443 domain-containing protein [Paraburkholderia domus]MBK5047580.1 DUF3443 domain-containing protein [Burkholderia sp. R-70006]CAE6686420.1 hypothetical protein R70006_00103 [Paraburkholderia domus]
MRTMQSVVKLRGWVQAVVAVALVSVVAACGGGGGSSSSSNNNNSSGALNGGSLPPSPTQLPIAANAANTVPITVARGVNGVINIPTVTVTVCPPGTTSNCQIINNVQVDTGSFGLRVVSSAVNTSLLPVSTLSSGAPLAECATFADGFTWGTVRTATVQIGGETTAAIPIQIIGDPAAGAVPSGCASGPADNTATDLGANGILGIGTALTDCGATCSTPSTAGNSSNYFTCSGGTCARATVPLNQQVANPAANFAADNNGVIVQLPPVSNTGQSSATGTLVFGIGTQSNNALAASQTFATDGFGDMNKSVYNGTTVQAFFDSGSNAYFFADSSLAPCGSNYPGFYCPSSAQTRSITLAGQNSTTASVSIGILSAATLFGNTSNYAFNDLAGQIGGNSSFDLGLPFFYGRHVYYGFDLTSTTGQTPYVGF